MLNLRALSDTPEEAVAIAAEQAPYLAKLQSLELDVTDPRALLASAHALCEQVAAGSADPLRDLRDAKHRAHLAIAASDLSGQASLEETTF